MGPPTNVDGEATAAAGRSSRIRGFNGAADKRRRRGGELACRGLGQAHASMGPPTNVDGELRTASMRSAAS